MQVRNLSPHTQRAYIENVARFARHFGRSPVELGPEEIRSYQVYLTRERKLAPSSLGIAVCALRFLYKITLKQPWSFDDLIPAPKKPRRLPVVLSPDEVVRALDCVTTPKHRAVLTTCYAAGLRTALSTRAKLLIIRNIAEMHDVKPAARSASRTDQMSDGRRGPLLPRLWSPRVFFAFVDSVCIPHWLVLASRASIEEMYRRLRGGHVRRLVGR